MILPEPRAGEQPDGTKWSKKKRAALVSVRPRKVDHNVCLKGTMVSVKRPVTGRFHDPSSECHLFLLGVLLFPLAFDVLPFALEFDMLLFPLAFDAFMLPDVLSFPDTLLLPDVFMFSDMLEFDVLLF